MMQRVLVVGSGGAGKSTFSDELGTRTGLPVVHLDRHFWKPGWVPTPRDDWRARQEVFVAADAWILDGNYSGTLDVRLARADTIVLLDMGRFRCLWRVVKRTIRNWGRAVTAPGCPDRFELEFTRWVWAYPARSRPRILDAVDHCTREVDFVRLRTPQQVRQFLHDAARTRPTDADR